MNILHITLGFYPSMAWGGPIKIVHHNCKELVKRGHKVTICCTNLLDKKRKIEKQNYQTEIDGIAVLYFNTWNISWWPGTLGPIWLPDFNRYLCHNTNRFDIVHLNGYRSPMMLMASIYARKYNVPIITQPHGTLPNIINSFWFKKIYDTLAGKIELKGISALIALQKLERRQAMDRGVPENRIHIIPNGIDAINPSQENMAGRFRHKYGLDARPIILFLARINKVKGADMLVEAFSKLDKLNAQLAIVGPDDGQLQEIITLIERHKLRERAVICGPVSENDKNDAFYDADLFVLPSRYDAYPTTVMEACQYGKPMVITDRCESAHLLKNRVAEIVPFEPSEFAAAIYKLLTNRDLYESYKMNCKILYEDIFSIKKVVNQLEHIYQQAVVKK